nr:Arc family DNA-binding protein [uncultured Dethiosulfovibrio sp.]
MEVVVSTLRWPVEVYRELKAKAEQDGKSINQTVVECVKANMERGR